MANYPGFALIALFHGLQLAAIIFNFYRFIFLFYSDSKGIAAGYIHQEEKKIWKISLKIGVWKG